MGLGGGVGRGNLRRDKTAPRILMLVAVCLLAISQIVGLFEGPSTSYPAMVRASQVEAGISAGLPLSGWDPHPQAYLIIALLGCAFWRDEIAEQAQFRRVGYWIALILVFATLSPGSPTQGAGAGLGGIAFPWRWSPPSGTSSLPRMVVSPFARRAPPERLTGRRPSRPGRAIPGADRGGVIPRRLPGEARLHLAGVTARPAFRLPARRKRLPNGWERDRREPAVPWRHGGTDPSGSFDMTISRRNAMKIAAAGSLSAGAVLAGGGVSAMAQAQQEAGAAADRKPAEAGARPGWHRVAIGDALVTVVLDGLRPGDGPHPTFGENQSAEAVAALMRENFLPETRFVNGFNPVLVETGGTLVLFDTGMGAMGRANGLGKLVERMGAAGYEPGDVDLVVLTTCTAITSAA